MPRAFDICLAIMIDSGVTSDANSLSVSACVSSTQTARITALIFSFFCAASQAT
jgi:hypothetical protein